MAKLRIHIQTLLGAVLLLAAGIAHAEQVITYYHVDASGTPVAKTDQAGNIIWRASHEPYGKTVGTEPEDGPAYTGHVSDASTGLIYAEQRYYDPGLGLFLSADPAAALEEPLTAFHRYRYANGNPYRFRDPDGRRSLEFRDPLALGCASDPKCAYALEGEDDSTWSQVKSRLGLSGDLTKNGNILDFGALFHDVVHPAMEMPAGKGLKVAGMGFFALKLGPAAGTLSGLGNIGSHGVVDSAMALNSATRWLGKGYAELAPGVYRSSDGLRQFRMTTADLKGAHATIGSHVHFEALDKTGKVVENLHLGIKP